MIKRAGESKFALLHTHGDTVYDTFIGELIVLVKNYAASMGSRPDSPPGQLGEVWCPP